MAQYEQDVPSTGAEHWLVHRSSRRFLGEHVRQARRAARWTQQELAAEVGIHPCRLSRYERGSDVIPARLLVEMADALDLRIGSGRPLGQRH